MPQKENWHGTPVYTIENDHLTAQLAPSLGGNLYRLWDRKARREVLRTPEHPQQLAEALGHYGTPLMLPPNRIRHGRFTYDGREYTFDINTPTGHHIHGFLRTHPWEVDESASTDDSITIRLRTADHVDILKQYPHALDISITYKLEGPVLKQTARFHNQSPEAAPIGYGLHTWFALDGRPEEWSLYLPTESLWVLDEQLMPTGERIPLGDLAPLAAQPGMNLNGANLDHVFQIGDNPCLAVLRRDGYELRYSSPQGFKQWVIYTKGVADEWICLEPYTWVTNAPNLTELPPEVTGLRAIPPGDTLTLEVNLELIR